MTFELVSHTVLVAAAPDRGAGPVVRTIPRADDVFTSNSTPISLYHGSSIEETPMWATWVGLEPRLDVADQDTRYGEVFSSAAGLDATHGIGILNGPWTPPSGSTPVSAVIEFEAWCADPVRWAGTVQTTFHGTGSFSAGNITSTAVAGWTTGTITLGFPGNATVWNLFAAAVADGNITTYLRAFQSNGSTLYAGDFRVSQVALKVTMSEEGGTFLPVPFGRTGCDLLPDGSYVVACYSDMQTLPDVMNVWKISSAGDVLGQLVIETTGDTDGRAHVIALDGFLVQVLYPTGTYPGGMSYVLDCSGDTPELVASFDDSASTANAYGSPMHHLYLRAIGVVAVCHRAGTSLYRRGRHLISRSGADATGEVYGIYPHPDDPAKFAAWFSSGASNKEFVAWEYTVTPGDGLLVEELGPYVPSDDIWWMVGGGNPYASVPLALQEGDTGALEVIEAADPLTKLWVDPAYVPDSYEYGINADNISCDVGDGPDFFAFSHELWHDNGPWNAPTRTQFTARVGLVDNRSGIPAVQVLDLEYGASSPAGYPDDMNYVSLNTGSMAMTARNGELVVSTCLVQQEGLTNYYAVVSWKLSLGEAGRARLSGFWGGQWRQGINNATGLLSLQTTAGMLPEASEVTGLDAPAHPAWMKTSTGWELIGRFVEAGAADLPDPVPPPSVDVIYQLTDINVDLDAAVALAGENDSGGGGWWGPFVAQASPPTATDLADDSDATFTTLAQTVPGLGPDDAAPVEIFTARLTPVAPVPEGAVAVAAAFTIRSRATTGDEGSYLDGQVTTSVSKGTIRARNGIYNLQLAWNTGPTFVTSSYGLQGKYAAYPEHPGRFTNNGYWLGMSLADALGTSEEGTAGYWASLLATPGFFITVQSASLYLDHGSLELAEMSLTMRYLLA